VTSAGGFRAQDLRPSTVGDGDWHRLTAAQRELLCLDGTVTRHLARVVGEPVDIDVIRQRVRPVGRLAAHWLQVDAGSPAIVRGVVAVASGSGQPLFCARTFLLRELLPSDFVDRLRTTRGGLGAALEAWDVPTSRELLWWGRGHVPSWAVQRGLDSGGLTRTYRFRRDQPFALVTEWFPSAPS
jgi:chorismate-pyruvate lyase